MTQDSPALLTMNTMWIGNNPGTLQQLCMLSAAARGHKVRLFSYGGQANLPACIEQCDAREVLPENEIWIHKKTGAPGAFADWFRVEMIRKGFGAWMDADMLFLKPVSSATEYLLAWEDGKHNGVSNALMHFDPNSKLADDLCSWGARKNYIPPWWPNYQRTAWKLLKLAGMRPSVRTMFWGTTGPELLLYLCQLNQEMHHVGAWQKFCALPYMNKEEPFSAKANPERFFTAETVAIHLWYTGLKGGPSGTNGLDKREFCFEKGSLLWKVAKEVGLDTRIDWRAA